jgi:Na+/H+ antiporter NhaA
MILGLIVWACVTASNLDPTIAGILVASLIPARSTEGEPAMGPLLEEYFHRTVAFLILPLFALFNAGVVVPTAGVAEALARKLAILVASLLAAVWGAAVLHVKLPRLSAGITD